MSFATDGGFGPVDGGVETLNVSMNAVGKVRIFLRVNSVVLPFCEHGLTAALLDRITHHCPCPGNERGQLPAQAEPIAAPASFPITPLDCVGHRPSLRAGRRQPRGGRVVPRAGPSHGLR